MEQINQKWNKVMDLFFENPSKSFTIREISKLTKIPSTSIQRYLTELKKYELITEENKANITPKFKNKKIIHILNKIYESGIIEYLTEKYIPSNIILFGSTRKGEYDKTSDIDIFLESANKEKTDLSQYEKKLNHKIQLFVFKNINQVPADLLNNIINGIKLEGYIDLRQILKTK